MKIFTDHGEYECRPAPLNYVLYWEEEAEEADGYSLGAWELKRYPSPDGYSQGQIHEGWLHFVVAGISLDEVIKEDEKGVGRVEFDIRKIELTAVDAFDTSHKIIGEQPWKQLGSIQIAT
jgi:hypothetical protein